MKNSINEDINKLTNHLFRAHYGKMVSFLSKKYGYQEIENVLDAVQESFEAALKTWKFGEIPTDPFAWLYKVANNKLLNKIKQSNTVNTHIKFLSIPSEINEEYTEKEVEDSLLKLLVFFSKADFSERNKLIISLYFLCGFNYSEISNALIIKAEAVKKVVLRAKESIKKNVGAYNDLEIRKIEEVKHLLQIIYLIFNEGYKSSQKNGAINFDLCFETIRLGKLLIYYDPKNAEINALIATMFFNASRFPARIKNDTWISLENQDRNLWNMDLIAEGFYYLKIAKNNQQFLEKYYLEALVSSIHCTSKTYKKTDWKTIARLYEQLELIEPNSIAIKLNRITVESNFKNLPELLLELVLLEKFVDAENYFVYFSTKAHLYIKLKEPNLALENYKLALNYTKNKMDSNFINEKIKNIK